MINASRFVEYEGILPLTLYNPLDETISQGHLTGIDNEFRWNGISGTTTDNVCSFDLSDRESWGNIFDIRPDKDTFIDSIQKNGIFFKVNLFELEYTNLTGIRFVVEHGYTKSSDDTLHFNQRSVELWKEGEENKIACAYLPPSAFNDFFKEEDYVNTDFIAIYLRAMGSNFTLSGKFNKPMLLIPNINLEYCFPYFANLSPEDKAKTIEKTVPYFYGYKTLGDAIDLATPQSLSVTNLTELGDYSYRRGEDQVGVDWSGIGWGGLSGYNYARLNVTTNTSGLMFCNDADKYTHFMIGQLGQMECMRFGKSYVSSTDHLNEYGNYLYCAGDTSDIQNENAPAGEFSIDHDSYMRVNISDSGWDFLFKVSGFSDEDIYDWCKSFPSREGFPFIPHFNALKLGEIGAKKTEDDTVYTLGIAKLKLKNMVTVDTTSEKTLTNNGYPGPSALKEQVHTGKPYYARITAKYDNSSFELTGWSLYPNGGAGTHWTTDAPAEGTFKTLSAVSKNYSTGGTTGQSNLFVYWNPRPFTEEELARKITSTWKEVMLIDLTELYEAFPSFAAMSEADQKAILDTLPYFFGDMTLGGELENFSLDYPFVNSYATAGKYQEKNGERIFTLDKTLTQFKTAAGYVLYEVYTNFGPNTYYYTRSTVKNSNNVECIFYVFCDIEYRDKLVGNDLKGVNLANIPAEWSLQSVLGKRTERRNNDFHYLYNSKGYDNWPDGETAEVRFKESMLINLTAHGHYTLWRLMGLDDNAIKTMLDALPFFEDTYNVISPLIITATVGYTSFRPGKEVYSNELIEPEGAEAFNLTPSAYYPPENVGLRMLPQGKLVSNQFVETETATGIQVVREPIEEIPDIEFENMAPDFTLYDAGEEGGGSPILDSYTLYFKTFVSKHRFTHENTFNDRQYDTFAWFSFKTAYQQTLMEKDIIVNFYVNDVTVENNNGPWQWMLYFDGRYKSTDGSTKATRVGGDQVYVRGNKTYLSFYLNQSDWEQHPDDFVEWVGLFNIYLMFYSFTAGEISVTADIADFQIFVLERRILEKNFPEFANLSEEDKRNVCLSRLPYVEDRWNLKDLCLYNMVTELQEWDTNVNWSEIDERTGKYTKFERSENSVEANDFSRFGLSAPIGSNEDNYLTYHLHRPFLVYVRTFTDINETGVNLYLESCSDIYPYDSESATPYAVEGITYLPISSTGQMSAIGTNENVVVLYTFVYTGTEDHDTTAPAGIFTVKDVMHVDGLRGGYEFYKVMKDGKAITTSDGKLYEIFNKLPFFVKEFKILGFTKTGDFIGYVVE